MSATPEMLGLLGNLIDTAERALYRPVTAPGYAPALRDLCGMIVAAVQKPAPDGRYIDAEAVMLCQALDAAARARVERDLEIAARFDMVAASLLVMVRVAMARALEAARRPVETTDR